jgi:hypothetical protein
MELQGSAYTYTLPSLSMTFVGFEARSARTKAASDRASRLGAPLRLQNHHRLPQLLDPFFGPLEHSICSGLSFYQTFNRVEEADALAALGLQGPSARCRPPRFGPRVPCGSRWRPNGPRSSRAADRSIPTAPKRPLQG